MKRGSFAAPMLSLVIGATALARQGAPGSTGLFHFERPVDTGGAGPRRLAVDVPLLAETRQDLGDLRLIGQAGDEIPYLLLRPADGTPVWAASAVLATPTTEKASGFEADLGDPFTIDGIRVRGLPIPFLKRLSLEGSGDRQHWTVLLPEATLFDLPGEGLQQLELPFTPGDYRYLRVTWNDANSGRVPLPAFVQARRVTPLTSHREPLTAALHVEQRASEPGASRYRLQLPAPKLPVVGLTLVVENDRVMRQAVVTEPRLSGARVVPIELGRATLRRVVRDDAAAEALTIPIARPMGSDLDLAVDDGSNPPLRLASVLAVFARQPDVYFEATGTPVVARYGNPQLAAPRYDLAAARDTIEIDRVPRASWGEPRPLAAEPSAPAPPDSSGRGASIDLESFQTVRNIPAGDPTLVSLELDAAALAHSTGPNREFSDVRVVDGEGRQVPYLVERCVAPLVVDLTLGQPRRDGAGKANRNVSEYRLTLPYAGLPGARIALNTNMRVFSRRVVVGRERAADRAHREAWFQALAEADWIHGEGAIAAPALLLPLPPVDTTDLRLRVEEGDNAPLPLTSARLMLPGYRLRFFRGAGEQLRLAYGRPTLDAPRYDIQLLTADVLGRPASEVRASGEPSTRASTGMPLVSPRVFWGALGIAVVVLLALAVRLMRGSEGS